MKRLIVMIDGTAATSEDVKEANSGARKAYSKRHKVKKDAKPRSHRALTPEEREEKRLRTERRKILAVVEREEREHAMFMRRLKRVIEKDHRASERRVIDVGYKPSREPGFQVICPKSLFRRNHVHAERRDSRPGRTAKDGQRNIVLKFSCRGFGRKQAGTRAYVAGEAGRIARYICRLEGLEDVEGAVITNVISPSTVRSREFSIGQMQQIAGFLNALEEIERATGPSHVYQHLILALPYELGPEGRARALARYCVVFERLKLPFCGALHCPDPEGNQRNFHAHIVLGARPFEYQSDYAWSFDAEKFTEIISKAARPYLRGQLEDAFNAELKGIGSPIRYSGVPEEDRGSAGLSDEHKGQKEVARERAAERETEALRSLFAGLAAHILAMKKRLAKIRTHVDEREAQRKLEEVQADASRTDVTDKVDQPPLQAKGHERATPDPASANATLSSVAPVPLDRQAVIRKSMWVFDAFGVSSHVETLAMALSREPQAMALALYEGRVQIAFEDPQLVDAVKSVAENPLTQHWLTKLAKELPFDHANVSANWQYASVHQGQQVWLLRADHWAARYGRVESHGQATAPTPDRSLER